MKNVLKPARKLIVVGMFAIAIGIGIISSCTENMNETSTLKNTVIPQNLSSAAIKKYIKTNSEEMTVISRRELGSYAIAIQKQIHRILTPEKRYSLWNEKFDELMAGKWTDQETVHLNKFRGALCIELFEGDEESLIQFKVFTDEWALEGIENIGWSADFIRYIGMSYSFNDREIIKRAKNSPIITLGLIQIASASSGEECNCSTSDPWWCGNDPCNSYLNESCGTACGGCGFILAYCCDGYCPGS